MNIPLILFAKAPIPGQVKTRLQTHCSEAQAAKIFEILLETTISNVCRHWPGDVVFSVWLDHSHSFIQALLKQYPLKLDHQTDGHLGEKMHAALSSWGYPAAVMGCDVPVVQPHVFQDAYAQLENGHNVIGPSIDGGYYFLGLCQAAEPLFVDQAWGGDQVFAETERRATAIGLPLNQLSTDQDVDTWPDLLRLVDTLPALRKYLLDERLIAPN